MKKGFFIWCCILAVLGFAPFNVLGQDVSFQWVSLYKGTTMGGLTGKITTDVSGNVYTTGTFRGIYDFDPGPGVVNFTTHAPWGNYNNGYITKMDPNGNLIWAKQLVGTTSAGVGIAIDPMGNVVVGGIFSGYCDFNPGPASFQLSSSVGNPSFILKLDAQGEFIQASKFGEGGVCAIKSLQTDKASNIYVTGEYNGSCDFDPSSLSFFTMTSKNSKDIFAVRLNTSLDLLWAASLGGPEETESGQGISVDDNGNVYVTGWFSGTADFDPGPGIFPLVAAQVDDAFVCKLGPAGNLIQAFSIGGSGYSTKSKAIVAGGGSFYITGSFADTVDFDPGPGTFFLYEAPSTPDASDIFVASYDMSGSFKWARRMGGSALHLYEEGNDIALDRHGNPYVAGTCGGPSDFGPFLINSNSDQGAFITRLGKDGSFIWVKPIRAQYQHSRIALEIDDCGNVYTTASFRGTTDFDPGPAVFNLTTDAGYIEVYVHKMISSGCRNIALGKDTAICAGDTLLLAPFLGAEDKVLWNTGDTTRSLLVTKAGIYYLSLTSDSFVYSDTIVVSLAPGPVPGLANLIRLCVSDSLLLTPKVQPGEQVLWSTGDTTPSILVKQAGTYRVTVINAYCRANDSAEVSFGPRPIVYVGPDSAFCGLVDHLIQATTDGIHFKWNTNDTTKNLYVNKEGVYSLRVKSADMCENADTVKLDKIDYPFPPLQPDTVVCGNMLNLDARNPGCSYLWNTGEQSRVIQAKESGRYSVIINNGFCSISDTVNLVLEPEENCLPWLYIPNSFTPDGDGLNDVFSVRSGPLLELTLTVYDRWGEKLFETNRLDRGWNGMYKDKPVPEGVYFYRISYTYPLKGRLIKKNQNGTLHLLR